MMGIKNSVQENAMKLQLKSCFKGSLLSLIGAAICLIPSMAHAADLSITKTGPATTTVGSSVTFTLSGATNGPQGLPNGVVVTVTDTLPSEFTSIVVLNSPTWSCHVTGQVVTCTRSTVIPGNTGFPLITVGAVAHTAGSYQNCAHISYVPIVATPQDMNLANNNSCVNGVITAGAAHDVSITKTVVPGPFTVGGYVEFTLHPGNSGPGSLSVGSGDVSITDMIPAGFSFAGWSSPSGWTCPLAVGTPGPVAIVCNYSGSPVAAGNPMSTINIAIRANVAGSFQNCADITYNHPPGDNWPANNHACVPFVVGTPPLPHDVDITKTVGSGPFTVGGNVVFTLHPHNAGPTTLSVGPNDVTVTDTVPAGFTYVSATGTGWLCPTPSPTVGPFTITCTYPTGPVVNAGNPMNAITVTLKATATGTRQNCTDITYNHVPGDAWPANNHGCASVTVSATGTVTVKKILVPATDLGRFTLQLTPSGGTLLANYLDAANGAVMGPVTVPAGNYIVSEVGGSTGTSLANYTSVISGAGCAANGTVTVASGDSKVCTITNTRNPTTATMNFQIQKQFQGPAVPGTYTFHISCTGGTGAYTGPGTINLVVPPNPSATSIVVPVGSTCMLTENPVSGWQTPLFGGSSQPINPNLTWGATIGPFQPTNTVTDRVLVTNRP
jgi:uncharacterized repeat protein (TIGR01451 family)